MRFMRATKRFVGLLSVALVGACGSDDPIDPQNLPPASGTYYLAAPLSKDIEGEPYKVETGNLFLREDGTAVEERYVNGHWQDIPWIWEQSQDAKTLSFYYSDEITQDCTYKGSSIECNSYLATLESGNVTGRMVWKRK